jgi:class 3 adenylate cyclase
MNSVETVTILITDLVGSTGLESRIGPGAADELRDEHFALLRGAIDEAGGRETKNTGDGLIAAFDSASQAVSCAVSVQQRFERRNRKSDEQLLIKVGLSLGDATAAADGDYFGMPVIEAARLCDRASGGQILAKEIVAHLAGGRADHAFKAVGDLELKGIPEALATVEVAWEPLGEEAPSLPLPPRLQEMPPGGFVGRAAERERLTELIEEASDGNRRVALISGEPGIGKTRLATHTALEARAQGSFVLYGRCDEELGIPYGPWVEALTHYVEHGPEAMLRAHVERHGGELARLVPALRNRLDDVPPPTQADPDTERYLLLGAVLGLLREASADEPLVLVLDDLHWADKPTLLLLKHVVSQGQGARALIVATYRESDLARGHPLTDALADLHREQGVERIALKGLAEPDIAEVIERAAGHELDEAGFELSRQLFRETDGNPFYTGELLRHLLESGGVYQREDGRWTVRGVLSDLGLPQSVREVLGRRIERLGEDAHRALSVAAVIGREFDADLLLAVGDHSEDELLELLEESVAASVLVESSNVPGRFSFAHALISHSLYEDLGTTRRARLHRLIADALEELLGPEPGSRISELAHHWAKATTAVDLPKAISYARLAGDRALGELAPDEALRWFSQALEFQAQQSAVDQAQRCDLLIGMGEAQRQVGEPAFRETLLEAARIAADLGDADRAAAAALANNRGQVSVFGEIDQDRLRALESALELDRFANPARCARLISLQTMELAYEPDHEHRRALADEALALARDVGDPRILAHVLRDHFVAYWAPDSLELRRGYLRELEEASVETGDPGLRAWAAYCQTTVYAESCELQQAHRAAQRLKAIADELGQPTLRWLAAVTAAGLALVRGDLADCERLATEALQIGSDAGEPDAYMVFGAHIAPIRTYEGHAEEIVELTKQAHEANPGISGWRAGLPMTYCWLGRTAEAVPLVEEAAKDGFAHIPYDQARATTLALYADAASQAAVKPAAATLYDLMEPTADQMVWNGASTYGHFRTYLGMLAATLGWQERADEHFARACQVQEREGMLLWAAHAHLGWAEALAARGEAERARTEAARALELSREHGYGAIEARAAAVIETGAAAQR